MSPLVVHQALHGYNDGHRLISSSIPLDGAEARVMLVMSDLSGSGVKPPENGYLTGYPLEKAGKYVLARTWAAPEMPRPGCVWTHSLIIDNADLAQVRSAVSLLQAFRRPDAALPRSGYTLPLSVIHQAVHAAVNGGPRARDIVNALYGQPDRVIVASAEEAVSDEHLVVGLWMQQWPRLRRVFGFCTLSGADRSKKGVALDLQLAPLGEHHLETKFPGAVAAGRTPPNDDLEVLVRDLVRPGDSELREFLRRTGGDVEGGRKAMLSLCRLYTSILETSPIDLRKAVTAFADLDRAGRPQARSVRSLVARQAVQAAERVDDEVFEFLVDTLENTADPKERVDLGDRLGLALWRRSPERFSEALHGETVLGAVASHSIATLSSSDVIAGLKRNPNLVSDMVQRRPDLLLLPDLWRMPEAGDHLVELVPETDMDRLAMSLMAAGRSGPARYVIEHVHTKDLVDAFGRSRATDDTIKGWLAALSHSPNKVAGVLASGRLQRADSVVDLARRMNPDAVPNDYGDDPWLIALSAMSGSTLRADEDYLACYMLARALGNRSRSQAPLIRYAYTTVYRALQHRRLPSKVENLVLWRLNWGTWFEWDSCSRLRETVVCRFIEHNLDPETFGRLTDDGALAISLIDEAARSGRGRRYLDEVRKSLKNASEKGIKARADYIAKKIK